MNGPAPITGDDIHAFGPSPGAGTADPPARPGRDGEPPRRRWPRVLFAIVVLFVLVLLAMLALTIPLAAGLAELTRELNSGWAVTIDGRPVALPELGEAAWMVVAFALVVALAAVALVVPLGIGAALFGATLAAGLALLAALVLLAAALAPLGLAGWLLWRALRRPRRPDVEPPQDLAGR
jgi:MFS family permease